jgi:uncharacterized protein (TIGR04255 family)
VCGITFKKLEKLKIPSYGLFWADLRKDFPTCEHAAPLEPNPDSVDPATGLPLPRIWLIGKTENDLLQLQNDRILYNWRKIRPHDQYPRYHSVVQKFKGHLSVFIELLDRDDLGSFRPLSCELTYVNHLVKGEGWQSVGDLKDLFPDLGWRSGQRFLPDPTGLGWKMAFDMEQNLGKLTVTLNHGTRKIDAVPILVLQLTAQGSSSNESLDAVWDWFNQAHEWIVRGFADLTDPDVQDRLWNRTVKI